MLHSPEFSQNVSLHCLRLKSHTFVCSSFGVSARIIFHHCSRVCFRYDFPAFQSVVSTIDEGCPVFGSVWFGYRLCGWNGSSGSGFQCLSFAVFQGFCSMPRDGPHVPHILWIGYEENWDDQLCCSVMTSWKKTPAAKIVEWPQQLVGCHFAPLSCRYEIIAFPSCMTCLKLIKLTKPD